MRNKYWAINNIDLLNIINAVNQLNKNLEYPNSENSNDEKQYMERDSIVIDELIRKYLDNK